jgi:hypothetical protein
MANRCRARHPGRKVCATKSFANQTLVPLGMKSFISNAGNTAGFLPPMLKGVQSQCNNR